MLVSKVGLKIIIQSSKGKEFIIQDNFVQELDRMFNGAHMLMVT
jgi:hypothetical protein